MIKSIVKFYLMTSVCFAGYTGDNEAIKIAYEIGEVGLSRSKYGESKACLELFAFGRTFENFSDLTMRQKVKRFDGISSTEYATKKDYEEVSELIKNIGLKFPSALHEIKLNKEKPNEKFVELFFDKGFKEWEEKTKLYLKSMQFEKMIEEAKKVQVTEHMRNFINIIESNYSNYSNDFEANVCMKSIIPYLENANDAEKVFIPYILRETSKSGQYGELYLSESDFKTEFGKKMILGALSEGNVEYKKSIKNKDEKKLQEEFKRFTKIENGIMFDGTKAISILGSRWKDLDSRNIFEVFYKIAPQREKFKDLYNTITGIKELNWEDELQSKEFRNGYLKDQMNIKELIESGNFKLESKRSTTLNGKLKKIWEDALGVFKDYKDSNLENRKEHAKCALETAFAIIDHDALFSAKELGLYKNEYDYLDSEKFGILLDEKRPPEIKRRVVEHKINGFFVIPDSMVLMYANLYGSLCLDYFSSDPQNYKAISEQTGILNSQEVFYKGTNYSLPQIFVSEIKRNRPWLKPSLNKELQEGGGKFESIQNVKYSDAYAMLNTLFGETSIDVKETVINKLEEFKQKLKIENNRIEKIRKELLKIERYYEQIVMVIGEMEWTEFFLNFEQTTLSNGNEGNQHESCNPDAFALTSLIPYKPWLVFFCDVAIETTSTAISEDRKKKNKITREIFFDMEEILDGKENLKELINEKARIAFEQANLKMEEEDNIRIGHIIDFYKSLNQSQKTQILEKVRSEKAFRENLTILDAMQKLNSYGTESDKTQRAIKRLLKGEKIWQESEIGKYYKELIDGGRLELEMAKPEEDITQRVLVVFENFGVSEEALTNTVKMNGAWKQIVDPSDKEDLESYEKLERKKHTMYQRTTLMTEINELANSVVKYYKGKNGLNKPIEITSEEDDDFEMAKNIVTYSKNMNLQDESVLNKQVELYTSEEIGTPQFNKIKNLVLEKIRTK